MREAIGWYVVILLLLRVWANEMIGWCQALDSIQQVDACLV
jgi:hypothetical protein